MDTPIYISRSNITTKMNKTGSWRFVRPVCDEKTAPCSASCPAGEDIGRIEMLVSTGKIKSAWETILRENPFPSVCGRVCFHPCETACNRAGLDLPVAINDLERFVGDTGLSENMNPSMEKLPPNGKRIAIAGAGPAGLSAACFLAVLGYECDVFETETEPGGVLRWGIPEYRLPGEILKKEIDRITGLGPKIFCQKPFTKEYFDKAGAKYDAVFIGCGHAESVQMEIKGEDLAEDGLKFLKSVRKGASPSIDGTALIIGGGNTALDLAGTLTRMGASSILVYRRRKQDMPAFSHEVEAALEEGIELIELAGPVAIEKNGDKLALTSQVMKSTDTDSPGRAGVEPDGSKTRILMADRIFTAIGAKAGVDPLFEESGDILKLDHCTLLNQDIPVVLGGDLTNTVKSVADAVASGKQAAMVLDIYFRNGMKAIEPELESCRVGNEEALSMEIYIGGKRGNRNPMKVACKDINMDYFGPAPRKTPTSLSPVERARSFSEIRSVYSLDFAMEESRRCFNCGICNDCDNCRLFCPEMAVDPPAVGSPRRINTDYCKGCGVCAEECPRSVLSLEEESI